VVVSDWDGYRDTVRDGVDGFRIPTLMPQPGLGGDLAWRHAVEVDTYDMYCGHTCLMVAVDVQAAAQAFTRLFESRELRLQMGEAGRQRAREVYDWAAIMARYEALWAQQDELRRTQAASLPPPLPHPWPARMDPFHAFAVYPTQALTPHTVLALAHPTLPAAQAHARACRALAMVGFAREVLPTEAESLAMLEAAAGGPRPAGELVAGAAPARQPFLLRTLATLVKLGLLAVSPSLPQVQS
jgi:alpha-maltose-1-phosphate synthase